MNVFEIVFSPTGGTQKVSDIIVDRWNQNTVRVDLSDPDAAFTDVKITADDLVLIAMPSFGGRAPKTAMERLGQIAGNSAKCVIVCVYGNRAYEDTLVEMEDGAKSAGFHVIAGVSAVAQHSIIHEYAAGRPDDTDRQQLASFADQIMNNLNTTPHIPGTRPYKKTGAGLVPKPTSACTKCGICAASCPVKAISTSDNKADSKICISCMRCVEQCPEHVRSVNGAMVKAAALAIRKACSVRKDNELFQ